MAAFFKRGLPPDGFDAIDLLVLGSLKPPLLTTDNDTPSGSCGVVGSSTDSTAKDAPRSLPVESLVAVPVENPGLRSSVRTAIRDASVVSMERKRRIEAFEAFILTMSDGHLVTGFASVLSTIFLLAGVQSWDARTSVWTFQVAAMLGYFSFIVHLCSLTVTRQYFDDRHPALRHMRTLLIALFLVFECVVLGFRQTSALMWNCAMTNTVDDALTHSSGFVEGSINDRISGVVNMLFLITCLAVGMVRRTLEIYIKESRQSSLLLVFVAMVCRRKFDTLSSLLRKYSAAYLRVELRKSHEILERVRNLSDPHRSKTLYRKLFGHIGTIARAIWLIEGSHGFSREIQWLLFYFVLGTAHLFRFLARFPAEAAKAPANFGQLMPVFILILPAINAFEAFSGGREYATAVLETAHAEHEATDRAISHEDRHEQRMVSWTHMILLGRKRTPLQKANRDRRMEHCASPWYLIWRSWMH